MGVFLSTIKCVSLFISIFLGSNIFESSLARETSKTIPGSLPMSVYIVFSLSLSIYITLHNIGIK